MTLHFLDEKTIDSLPVFENSALPDIYFHSTKERFTEFCFTKRGENTCDMNTKQGFFFTDLASLNKMKKDHPYTFGDILLKVRLDIKKPIDLTVNGIFSKEDQAATIWKALMGGEKVSTQKAIELLNEEIGLGELEDLWEQLSSDNCLKTIKRHGYDGIISEMGKGHLQYVAFHPKQIQILTVDAITKAYHEGTNQILVNAINSKMAVKKKSKRLKL